VFEWDTKKAAANLMKHEVSIDEAATVFVAYTQRRSADGDTIRIISARRASRKERSAYAGTAKD